MASLLLGAGALAYDQVQKSRAKRKARLAHNDARFSALERENANRIASLQQDTCFCQRSDWRGGGCEAHGYVPPAPGNQGCDGSGYMPPSQPPAYDDVTNTPAPESGSGSHGVNGDGSGSQQGQGNSHAAGRQRSEGQTEGWTTRPPTMDDDEIARINEKRRKKKQARKGYKLFFGGKSRGAHDEGSTVANG
ncbi:MAG: hypothetical protein Q9217_001541 [Psora testacea]